MSTSAACPRRRHLLYIKDPASAITHFIAAIGFGGASVPLLIKACQTGRPLAVFAMAVYAASLIALYAASTAYHTVAPGSAHEPLLKKIDHMMIFVLIAGSYTPFCLVVLKGMTGIALFAFVWAIAVFGIVFQRWLLQKSDWLNCGLYLLMGWSVLPCIKPLVENLPSGGLWLLAAGGVTYSVGVVFYIWQSLKFSHAIWHVFVLAGSVLQYLAVLLYVIPVLR